MLITTAAAVAGGAVLLGSALYLGPGVAASRMGRRRLAALCRARRTLVLTYDDGPGAELTPSVLDLLAARRARATFFLLGRRAEQNPAIVDRIVRDGHEVGCHSHAHLHAWKSWPGNVVNDIDAGYRALDRWIRPDGVFRPPYGKASLSSLLAVRRRGASLGWWTLDSGDTRDPLPREPGAAAEALSRSGGGVALLHDFDRDQFERAERARFVLEATRMLLDVAEREGLVVRRIGDLLGGRGAGVSGAHRSAEATR